MAICHMINERNVNICDKTIFGFSTTNLKDCTCARCLEVIINETLIKLNDALMKIDELEDDLMVSNRAIALLSE